MGKLNISSFATANNLNEIDVRAAVYSGKYFATFKNNQFVIHTYADGTPKLWPVGIPRWVYFLYDEWRDATKVGATSSINSRFRQLQVGNACELKALGFYRYECSHIATAVEHLSKNHCYHHERHILGEWFEGMLNPESIIDSVHSEYSAAPNRQLSKIIFDSPAKHGQFMANVH